MAASDVGQWGFVYEVCISDNLGKTVSVVLECLTVCR